MELPDPNPILTWDELEMILAGLRGELPTETGKKQNFEGTFNKFTTRMMEKIFDRSGTKAEIDRRIISARDVLRFDRYRERIYVLMALAFLQGRKSVAENPINDDFAKALKAIPQDVMDEAFAHIRERKNPKRKKLKAKK